VEESVQTVHGEALTKVTLDKGSGEALTKATLDVGSGEALTKATPDLGSHLFIHFTSSNCYMSTSGQVNIE
jgi:hypothetical protein